jgi:hypothetical protein
MKIEPKIELKVITALPLNFNLVIPKAGQTKAKPRAGTGTGMGSMDVRDSRGRKTLYTKAHSRDKRQDTRTA